MYAIIETGGKQYRIEKGDVIDVELLKDSDSGKVTFDRILFLNDGSGVKVGAPYVQGSTVSAEIVREEVKGDKVIAYKYKKRKGFHKKKGHRQRYTQVRIKEIIG